MNKAIFNSIHNDLKNDRMCFRCCNIDKSNKIN